MLRDQIPSKDFVKTSQGSRFVTLKRLDPAHQQQIWRGIQRTAPELADVLQNDTQFNALKEHFDGTLVLDKPEAANYYRAGK